MAAVKDKPGVDLAKVNEDEQRQLAEYAEMYEQDRGAGYENQTSEDLAVPFIEILQAQSPEVMVEDGPKAGTLINRTTGEIVPGKEGVAFIPVTTQHVVVEWVPREKGGGLVATYQLDDPLVRKVREEQPLGKYKHPTNDNDLIETFYVYGILVNGDGSHPAVMAFTSTRITPYKNWMFTARSIVIALPNGRKLTKLPLFSHRYRITTEMKENNQGKWYAPVIKFDGDAGAPSARIAPSDDLYAMAKQLCEDVNSGKKVADTEHAGPREDAVDRAPSRQDTGSEQAPY